MKSVTPKSLSSTISNFDRIYTGLIYPFKLCMKVKYYPILIYNISLFSLRFKILLLTLLARKSEIKRLKGYPIMSIKGQLKTFIEVNVAFVTKCEQNEKKRAHDLEENNSMVLSYLRNKWFITLRD